MTTNRLLGCFALFNGFYNCDTDSFFFRGQRLAKKGYVTFFTRQKPKQIYTVNFFKDHFRSIVNFLEQLWTDFLETVCSRETPWEVDKLVKRAILVFSLLHFNGFFFKKNRPHNHITVMQSVLFHFKTLYISSIKSRRSSSFFITWSSILFQRS